MRKILLTTALLTAMSTMPVLAQSTMPTDFVTPEGYESATADSLTFQDLMGATVYDTRGESICDIADFVMKVDPATQDTTGAATDETSTLDTTAAQTTTGTADTDAASGTAGTSATDTTGTDDAMTEGTGAATGTEGAATGATDGNSVATDGSTTGTEGSDSTSTATDGTMTGTEGSDTSTAETDSTTNATDSATDSTMADTEGSTTGTATTDGSMSDGTGAATGTDTASGTAASDGSMTEDSTRDMAASISGEVSHAIIDVGGFLGMGTHTVAIPVEALQVFRATNASDVRIYLPWNEDQLKEIPEYVEGDQSTLGGMSTVSE